MADDTFFMKRFKALNVYLLALVVLFGSILNVHSHPDLFGSETTDSSKEIETAALEGREILFSLNVLFLNPYKDIQVSQVSLPLSDAHSHNFFTTFRLLNSYRIALPPPSIS